MQKSNWLRIGLVGFATLVGGATAMVACGGDDEVTPDGDGGTTSSSSGASGTTSSSSGSTDGGSSGASSSSGGPAPIPATVAVVHAFNAVGAVRICYAIGGTAAPEPGAGISPLFPLPNSETGLIPGSGGILPSTGTPLSSVYVRPYIIKSSAITSPASQCPDLIGEAATVTPALVEGTDYFMLDAIEKGALEDDSTYVLIAKEGPTAGRPVIQAYKLDTATDVPDDKIAVQFIHASPYLDKVTGLSPNVAPFFDRPTAGVADAGADSGDGGAVAPPGRAYEFFAGATASDKTAPFAALSALKTVDTFDVPNTAAGLMVTLGGNEQPILNRDTTLALIPVSTWATLSDPPPAPTQVEGGESVYFKAGRAFTFIALGDPTTNPATPEPLKTYLGPHYLVFPNRPVATQ